MADTMVNDRRYIAIDRVMQTVGGILLTVCLAITGWAVLRIIDLEGRVIRSETRMEARDADIQEIKHSIKEVRDLLARKP